jgi:IS5 family transposase
MAAFKGGKKHPLNQQQKKYNHDLESKRTLVEHVIRRIKIFRIPAERYRNIRKRFDLRVNPVAGIYNHEF